jgi:predicted dehydrogenase
MNRRGFIQAGLLAGAAFLLPAVSYSAQGTGSGRRKKPGPKPGFRLGYIGRSRDYSEFSGKLKGLVSVLPEKTNLREVRKDGIQAVIVSPSARRPAHTIRSLLEQQVPVLWQIPAGIAQSRIDAISNSSYPGKPFLLPFEPLYFERHVLQLQEYLATDNLGKIQSVRLQYNQPGSKGEEEDIAQLVRIIGLLHHLTGSWPESIEVQRPGEKLRALHPHAFFFSLKSPAYKAQGTTLPDYFGKETGWSIRIIGQKGQASLLADGTLEIFEPSEGKSWPVKAQQYDPLLGTRLQIEDFIGRVKGLRPAVNGMEEILYRKRIREALKKSLEDEREVNLNEF